MQCYDDGAEVILKHLHDEDCLGTWRVQPLGTEKILRCDGCRITYPATPENRLAAIDENYAGIYLRRLTAEGIRLKKEENS